MADDASLNRASKRTTTIDMSLGRADARSFAGAGIADQLYRGRPTVDVATIERGDTSRGMPTEVPPPQRMLPDVNVPAERMLPPLSQAGDREITGFGPAATAF